MLAESNADLGTFPHQGSFFFFFIYPGFHADKTLNWVAGNVLKSKGGRYDIGYITN